MKKQYVNELAQGQRVDSVFVLRSKEMRTSKTGEAYLVADASDRTGSISAVMFRPSSGAARLPAGGAVRLKGTVSSYRGRKRITVENVAPSTDFDQGDMIPTTRRDIAELASEFRTLAATIRDRDVRRIVQSVFGQDGFFDRFCASPGGQTYHHAHIGGLLEHTVAVTRICESLAQTYEHVNRDLLVGAALLHDVGKVDELTCNTVIEYTDEGRLLGHVILGERRYHAAVSRIRPAVGERVSMALSHAILSHHGELEWGAPKRPSTLEALLLHHADNMDAKAAGFLAYTSTASLVDERWTDLDNLFRRPLYAPRSIEDESDVATTSEDDEYRRIPA